MSEHDEVLTKQEVAARLKVSLRTVDRLDLPAVYLGTKTPRFLWSRVLDVLKERAA